MNTVGNFEVHAPWKKCELRHWMIVQTTNVDINTYLLAFNWIEIQSGFCNVGEFRCNNGRCIDSSLQNNGYDNCGDNSDEDYGKLQIIITNLYQNCCSRPSHFHQPQWWLTWVYGHFGNTFLKIYLCRVLTSLFIVSHPGYCECFCP